MKKCTSKPGQNYPRVLTFTTNTPERGLHLLENKSSGHLPKTFQSRALKNPFMVLICCWLCSFAYRLGGFILSSQGRHYQHRELSSNSEWSCCHGRARLPVGPVNPGSSDGRNTKDLLI